MNKENEKIEKIPKEEAIKSYEMEKKHKCDGGDDYGLVDCLQCEKKMIKLFNSAKAENKLKSF